MTTNLSPPRAMSVYGWNGLDSYYEEVGSEDPHWYCHHISHDRPSVVHSGLCPCTDRTYTVKCVGHGMQFVQLANGKSNREIRELQLAEKRNRDSATRERLTV